MAKSVRSKSKIKSRNALRAAVFGPVEAERIQRLAEKQRVANGTVDMLVEEDKTDAAMKNAESATTTDSGASEKKKKAQDGNGAESMDVETQDTTPSQSKVSNKTKFKKSKKDNRIVARNKKGRVMSKNVFKWVKQKRFKA
ncbi:hypothetical protein GGI12_006294 [Dipsacomyces acuminosporus]|nr:hypothetical protein GGI12_006294 [Dipsacomyces acuminosporus]